MIKRLRDKALRDHYILYLWDYYGEEWYSNAWMATKHPIFDGYKLNSRAGQIIKDGKQSLDALIGDYEYNLAEFVTDDDGYKLISSTVNDVEYKLNNDYYNLVMNIYPKALPYVRADGKLAPVLFKDNGDDVAFIMPLYR